MSEPARDPVSSSTGGPGGGSGRLDALRLPVRGAERRMRIARALGAGSTALCFALAAAALALALRKLGWLPEKATRAALSVIGAFPLVVAAAFGLRRLPPQAGAVALDRHYGLADRIASALSFSDLPRAEQTAFMDAAIDDALDHVKKVEPRRAVPIPLPPDALVALGLAALVVLVALFEVRTHQAVRQAQTIDAVDVTADDIDAMKEFLKDLQAKQQTDEAKAATQEFNQLIEDLAAKRLDRTEAFRRMEALENKLLEGNEADKKALEAALQKMGEELKKSELSKPTGEALDHKSLPDAEKALKELAKKLREQGNKIDKAQLEKMREALKAAAGDQKKRAEALQQKRDELEKSLLQQKQKMGDGGANEQEKSLLQKKERELERLDREREQQTSQQRQLDRLDRELQQAAEDLMKDLNLSANDLDQAAEDINRMAREQMSQQEKEQLKQKLDELRQMLRQQGQGGQGQMQRLRVFQQRAQGQGQPGQGQQGQGQQGQGQQGQGQQGQGQQGQGQQGQGQQGQGQGQGQQGQGGQGGQGQGGQGGETWILGPNGEKLMLITRGQGGQGQGGQGQGGQGGGQPGRGAGTGHDPNVKGAATNAKMGTQDTQVAGQDTGQGGSRSEVILGAAERGFASRGYKKVFREYNTVAEEALDKDEIPGGYRFYVRRYFQLIRPREGQE